MQIKNQAHFKADRVYILHIKCGEKKDLDGVLNTTLGGVGREQIV